MDERSAKSSIAYPQFPCCLHGQVLVPLQDQYPPELHQLLTDVTERVGRPLQRTRRCAETHRTIRHLNNAFSFCSLGCKIDQRLSNAIGGSYTFRLHGNLYHRLPSLRVGPDQAPAFAQLYLFDGDDEELQHRGQAFQGLDRDRLQLVQRVLRECNPYVQNFKSNAQRIQEDQSLHIRLTIVDDQGQDPRRYNRPIVSEVAALIPSVPGETSGRHIVMQNVAGGLQYINEYEACYFPLRYPLLYPRGESGWSRNIPYRTQPFHPGNPLRADEHSGSEELGSDGELVQRYRGRGRGGSRRVSQAQFYFFHIQTRVPLAPLLLASRLFHEWLVDSYAAIETNRLQFFRSNNGQFRLACYNGLVDALSHHDNVSAGDQGLPLILPATHIGSPRQMRNAYLDAMAIARHYGSPDYFITMTCNPRWIEITRELVHGQDAQDRPELQNRIFNVKLKQLMDELVRVGVFGPVLAYCYTIEFQKRGLPHVHILLTMHPEARLRTAEEVDAAIRADLPRKEQEPLLFDCVTRFMLHKPCGTANPRASCMREGSCRFKFPFTFLDNTTLPENGYPQYRRPDDSVRFVLPRSAYEFSSRDIAPYNAYLLQRFNAHINVQFVAGFASVKYAYKYIFKGPDQATASISAQAGARPEPVDEIKLYVDSRYIAAHEAAWRIATYKTHARQPSVQALAVHLEDQQAVVLRDGDSVPEVLQRDSVLRSTLTEYFAFNSRYKQDRARGIIANYDPTIVPYQDFPTKFCWVKASKRWQLRRRGFQLGRIIFVPPTKGELYYLRLLLTQVAGQTSFTDARTINGVEFVTYQAACVDLGLLVNDREYEQALNEASVTYLGAYLRELFVTILVNCQPAHPLQLWEKFRVNLADDCAYRLQTSFGIAHPTEQDSLDLTLCYIRASLLRQNRTLPSVFLPDPVRDFLLDAELERNRLLRAERSYDPDEQQTFFERSLPQLNRDQLSAFEQLRAAVLSPRGGVFFVDGPGGTGKTFLQKVMLASLRCKGKIALAVASTGIAATLLPGGTTAHSRFKIPINIDATSTCSIGKGTHLAELVAATTLVFWDEAVMMHRYAVEAVDRSFRDIRGNDLPFGGVVFCFCGDFRQTLPVVPKGSRAEIISACLKKSPLWRHVVSLPLRINMRLQRPGMDQIERDSANSFAQKLLTIGEGADIDATVQWPISDIVHNNSTDSLAVEIYPDLRRILPTAQLLRERAILAPRNDRVNAINSALLTTLQGSERYSLSVNTPRDKEGGNAFPIEFLNSVDLPGLPPHKLRLKVGCPVILLRNLDPERGLCNGTRLRVVAIQRRLLQCTILGGERHGEFCQFPRIPMPAPDNTDGVSFTRQQWPVKLAFAMTINKAQGQSLDRVGLVLDPEVFSHGQLYVALSRVTSPAGIYMVVPPTDKAVQDGRIKNVVYPEVFMV